MSDPSTQLRVDPVIVTTKTALTSAVVAAVEKGVSRVLKRVEESREENPGFGWITNADAMKLLGRSRPTLARYRASGKLPFSKLGSGIYYRVSDIEAILDAGSTHYERRN